MQYKYHFRYFSSKVGQEVREIYWQTIITNLALSLVFIFEPIYLYSLGFSISAILFFYAQVYLWYLILITWGAKFAGRFGYKHSILVSNIFYVLYWIVLYSIQSHHILFYLAPLFFALQKSFFWPAFDADIALGSKEKQRGREVGVLLALVEVVFIIGPFFGGFISQTFGFLPLFLIASGLMLCSTIPLFQSKELYSRHEFNLKKLYEIFKNNKSNFLGYWGYAEDLMIMSLWPIYIFLVIPNFFGVGVITTIATVVATMIMLYVGRLSDSVDKQKLVQKYAFFYSLTWIFRFLATNPLTVLFFDVLNKTGRDAVHVPVAALTLEKAGSKGSKDYALTYSVFYEASLSLAKVATALLGILILYLTDSIYLVFILAGVMTMFYGFLKSK